MLLSINKNTVFPVNHYVVVLAFFFILLLPILLPAFQFHVSFVGHMGLGSLFVPDTLGMQGSLYNVVEQGIELKYRTIFGVVLLYYPSYWLGNMYCYFVNCILLLFSCFFFIKTLPRLQLQLTCSQVYAVFCTVMLNFYILGVMLHPNKEIPLIFLTNVFVYYAVIKNKILLPMLVIAISATFRDAYSLILLLSLFALNIKVIHGIFHRRPYLTSIAVIVFFSLVGLKEIAKLNLLSDYNYILERNISVGSESGSALNELPTYQSFPLKFINNLFGSALRPQFIDLNGRFNFIGIGLWQFGVTLMLGILSWFYLLGRNQNRRHLSKIALLILICLLFVSFGSLTQPRYMAPYMFWLAAGFVSILKFELILIIFLGIILLSTVFSLIGFGALIPAGIDVYPYFN